jgi:Ni/Co efflux regulator RcnB
MKRFLLISTSLLLILPDIATAAVQAQTRPAPGQTRPAKPARPTKPPVAKPKPARPQPGRPQPARPRPPTGVTPLPQPVKPRPPKPNPGRPKPPKPRPPGSHHPAKPRPPHKWPTWRPGQQRPPHFKPIHRPGWHYPHGYRYRRWTIGLLLPALFLNRNYYFYDYDTLGIGPPPYGYRWVRYGPDLLLVQRSTGRIADVIYGAFY